MSVFFAVIVLLLASAVHAASSGFVVSAVDHANASEINKILSFVLADKYVQLQKLESQYNLSVSNLNDAQQAELRRLEEDAARLRRNLYGSKNGFAVVCFSPKDHSVCGYLMCEHGYRRAYIAEYLDIIIRDTKNFDTILQAMTKVAEQKLIALSMKKLTVHIYSRDQYNFFKKQNFILMDEDMIAAHYRIVSDRVVAFFGTILMPWLAALISHMDYGIFYKDLSL